MICEICKQRIPISQGNAHLNAHLIAGQAVILTINGRKEIRKTIPAIVNAETKETALASAPLPWLLVCCQDVTGDALEEFMKL